MSLVKYNVMKTATKRSWGGTRHTGLGTTAMDGCPRHGFVWNDKETRDLLLSWLMIKEKDAKTIGALAELHGRTMNGIEARLRFLNVLDSPAFVEKNHEIIYSLAASKLIVLKDNSPVYWYQFGRPLLQLLDGRRPEADVLEFIPDKTVRVRFLQYHPVWAKTANELLDVFTAVETELEQLKKSAAAKAAADFTKIEKLALMYSGPEYTPPAHINCQSKMTPAAKNMWNDLTVNEKLLLENLYHGNELPAADVQRIGASSAVTRLLVRSLIKRRGTFMTSYVLTDAGRALVKNSSQEESKPAGATSASDLPTNVETFFLVCRDEAYADTPRSKLVYPPRVKHPTRESATREAKRLAQANPGLKFYVMEASSVHTVETKQTTELVSRKL